MIYFTFSFNRIKFDAEEELGVTLFYREKSGLVPTMECKVLLPSLLDLLNSEKYFREQLIQLKGEHQAGQNADSQTALHQRHYGIVVFHPVANAGLKSLLAHLLLYSVVVLRLQEDGGGLIVFSGFHCYRVLIHFREKAQKGFHRRARLFIAERGQQNGSHTASLQRDYLPRDSGSADARPACRW